MKRCYMSVKEDRQSYEKSTQEIGRGKLRRNVDDQRKRNGLACSLDEWS